MRRAFLPAASFLISALLAFFFAFRLLMSLKEAETRLAGVTLQHGGAVTLPAWVSTTAGFLIFNETSIDDISNNSSMTDCPPFAFSHEKWYTTIADVLGCITPFLNFYVIYCIIFRSAKHMSTYRWLLLFHQVQCMIVDVVLALAQPVILLPFPMGYPLGLIRHIPTSILTAHQIVVMIFFILPISFGTIVHLFDYRYIVATGRKNFPTLHKAGIITIYSLASYIFPTFIVSYEDPRILLKELQETYTCIPKDFDKNPQFMVYRMYKIAYFTCIPTLGLILLVLSICLFLIFFTRRTLKRTSISRRSAELQQKFLYHLILQVAVPLICVVIPGSAFLYIIAAEVYGYSDVSFLFLSAVATYGAFGAIVLIIVNPSYRKFRLRKDKHSNTTVINNISPKSRIIN